MLFHRISWFAILGQIFLRPMLAYEKTKVLFLRANYTWRGTYITRWNEAYLALDPKSITFSET